jgi:hypothetical protein
LLELLPQQSQPAGAASTTYNLAHVAPAVFGKKLPTALIPAIRGLVPNRPSFLASKKLRPVMNRSLAPAAALSACLMVSLIAFPGLQSPAAATTRAPGSLVEIADCEYSYIVGGEEWSVQCRYRIDEGEWRTARSQGSGGVWELRLPGTSVQATVVDYKIEWSFGDEISSLRVGTRQVK